MKLERVMNNLTYVKIGEKFAIYFSYETPIAFEVFGENYRRVVCENKWSSTTGKHLNYIEPNKALRVPHEEFEAQLRKVTQ